MKGVYETKDYKYEGHFKDDQFHGKGKLVYKNKSITMKGIFNEG